MLGIEGLEASIGVISLGALDPETVGPQVIVAAEALAEALR